MALYIQVSKVG